MTITSSCTNSALIAVSFATTSSLVDDADESLYYTLYVLWDLVGVDDEDETAITPVTLSDSIRLQKIAPKISLK